NDVPGRYCSDHGLALSALRFCRRRHRGSDRHGWRFSDDAVADTAFRRPSAHGGGNRLALRRHNENGWHRNALQEGQRGLARGRSLGRRIGPRHGAHHLGPVADAEAEPGPTYHIHVDRRGTDHRGWRSSYAAVSAITPWPALITRRECATRARSPWIFGAVLGVLVSLCSVGAGALGVAVL